MLVTLALLFFVPLFVAMMMQSQWWGFQPRRMINAGQMVQPPVPLELEQAKVLYPPDAGPELLRGKWLMLYPYDGQCDQACMGDVTGLRQVHKAAGRNRKRVGIALLSPRDISVESRARLTAIYSQFVLLSDPAGTTAAVLALASAGSLQGDTGAQGRGFLLDPAGNIILAYAPGFDPSDINKDLKRLLRWSGQDKP